MSDVKRSIATWFVAFNCKIALLCYVWSFLSDTVEGPWSRRRCRSGAVVAVWALGLLCSVCHRRAWAGCSLLLAWAQLCLGVSSPGRGRLPLGAVLQAVLSAGGVCARYPALLYKAGTGRSGRAHQGRRAMQGQSCGLPALRPALFSSSLLWLWHWLFFFFKRGPFLKSLLNWLQHCSWFMLWFFRPGGVWDLSSLTRNWTRTPCIGRQSLTLDCQGSPLMWRWLWAADMQDQSSCYLQPPLQLPIAIASQCCT